jgi:hypothetical protein
MFPVSPGRARATRADSIRIENKGVRKQNQMCAGRNPVSARVRASCESGNMRAGTSRGDGTPKNSYCGKDRIGSCEGLTRRRVRVEGIQDPLLMPYQRLYVLGMNRSFRAPCVADVLMHGVTHALAPHGMVCLPGIINDPDDGQQGRALECGRDTIQIARDHV